MNIKIKKLSSEKQMNLNQKQYSDYNTIKLYFICFNILYQWNYSRNFLEKKFSTKDKDILKDTQLNTPLTFASDIVLIKF